MPSSYSVNVLHPMDQIEIMPETEIVLAHQKAQANLKKAKQLCFVVPGIILLGLISYIGFKIFDFFGNQSKYVIKEVMRYAPEATGPVFEDAKVALDRLVPVYKHAFEEAWNRDLPIYKILIENETRGFVEYSKALSNQIDERFQKLNSKILENVEKNLVPDLTGKEREEFEKVVAKTLYDRLEGEIAANWNNHMEQVKGICAEFSNVAKNTPVQKNESTQYMVGLGMELLGLKLQEISK